MNQYRQLSWVSVSVFLKRHQVFFKMAAELFAPLCLGEDPNCMILNTRLTPRFGKSCFKMEQ